jgi:hypothetical protein
MTKIPGSGSGSISQSLTGAETEIHKIKDDSKIILQTNLDRRGLRPIPIICHRLDPPSFSLPTTFNDFLLFRIRIRRIRMFVGLPDQRETRGWIKSTYGYCSVYVLSLCIIRNRDPYLGLEKTVPCLDQSGLSCRLVSDGEVCGVVSVAVHI